MSIGSYWIANECQQISFSNGRWVILVQFGHSVMSDSLQPHELQHARTIVHHQLPEFTQTHVHWVGDPIQPSHPVVPFSCPQYLPASESFPMSQLFAWRGQSTGVSALASFLPKKSQSWSPSEWTGWISLQSKGLSRVFSNYTVILRALRGINYCHQPACEQT